MAVELYTLEVDFAKRMRLLYTTRRIFKESALAKRLYEGCRGGIGLPDSVIPKVDVDFITHFQGAWTSILKKFLEESQQMADQAIRAAVAQECDFLPKLTKILLPMLRPMHSRSKSQTAIRA